MVLKRMVRETIGREILREGTVALFKRENRPRAMHEQTTPALHFAAAPPPVESLPSSPEFPRVPPESHQSPPWAVPVPASPPTPSSCQPAIQRAMKHSCFAAPRGRSPRPLIIVSGWSLGFSCFLVGFENKSLSCWEVDMVIVKLTWKNPSKEREGFL